MSANKIFNGSISRIRMAAALFVALDVIFTSSLTAVKGQSLCAEVISPLGYACNDYTDDDRNRGTAVLIPPDPICEVETPDGFLLGIYNIPYGRAGPGASRGAPVLLFHGFQAGGDNWVANSPEESLGTILADLGYDVWIGNNRNIVWSKGNTKYGYNDSAYWDWTWDDLGEYDVLTSVDFVYSQRGNTPISYICHSQGCMTFFAALTGDAGLRAQAEPKVRLAVMIAPFTYVSHVTAPLNKFILDYYGDTILPALGIGPVDVTSLVDIICKQSQMSCDNLISSLLGPDSHLNDTRTQFYLNFFPQVTSSKNFNHYGQVKRSQEFKKYDKGPIANLFSYGQTSPPLYDLSTFPTSFPVQMFTGGRDGLADPVDFQITLSKLPSDLNNEVHDFPNYGHLDFIIGDQAYVDIYPLIVSYLSTH